MNKKKMKNLILGGSIIILMLFASVGYSVLFNDSRLVEPTNLSTYSFIIQDTPMLVSGLLLFGYVIYLVIEITKVLFKQKTIDTNHTRIISSKLGYLGFFGFLGFLGFWTFSIDKTIFPFFFFVFFGFSSFFYEGKLSNVLKDELFKENETKATIQSYKTGFTLMFIMIWLIGMGLFKRNTEWAAIFMIITVSCIYALILFLSKYLLYKYETQD